MQSMYYIGLDVHKRTISYCVKDGSGKIHAEGTIPATRFDLDRVTGLSTAQTFRVSWRHPVVSPQRPNVQLSYSSA